MSDHATHILISYDFLPKIGGAHIWLYEVYSRWPVNVTVLTSQYSERPDEARKQRAFDLKDHGSIRIFRHAGLRDINLFDPRVLYAYFQQARHIARLNGGRKACLHVLRVFPEGLAALIYCKTMDRRAQLITYAHGEEVLVAMSSKQLSMIARQVYARSDLVVANSENSRHLVQNLCPQARVVCIHPGVDTEAYQIAPYEIEEFRSAWGWPAETIVICTIARMEARKNHRTVINSIAKLRGEGMQVAYVCAGDGEEHAALVELTRRLNLDRWIRFVGVISEGEKRMLFAASDIHAMPSIHVREMIEGFGIVFLEAAAAGIPSVCGNSGGQPEAVLHGKTGLIVNGEDIDSVSDAIRRLAVDESLRREMGASARNWALTHDWKEVKNRTVLEIIKIAPYAFLGN